MRGVAVLVYSPMISVEDDTVSQSRRADTQFSLEQMCEMAQFHTTQAARAMYPAHDNPMHKMIGA